MKIKKYISLALILFLIGTTKTYAACTQEEVNEFKKVEDEYKVTYELDKTTKKYYLFFERAKPNKFDYIIYTEQNIKCGTVNDRVEKCYLLEPGEYKLQIVGQTETCNNILKETTIKLPKYNVYSEDPICEGIEEFVLCNPSYDGELDYESFISRVETYKKTKQQKEEDDKNNPSKEQPKENQILAYIKDNLIQIIIIIVFIILLIITIIVTSQSIRKSRRLE